MSYGQVDYVAERDRSSELRRRDAVDNQTIEQKIDVVQMLQNGHTVQIKPQGYSMYPFFVPGRDEAIIEPYSEQKLRRGDVILYRRVGSILVLHRICRVREDGYYLVGDNQVQVEGPIPKEQVHGLMIEYIRKGRKRSVKNIKYRFLSGIWLWMRPIRFCITKPGAWVKRKLRRE